MLKIYNTLTRKQEKFKPLNDNEVSFYHCGPTIYWTQHIGNMRAMVLADLVRRSLEYLDYKVKMVRNYTDVGHLTSDEDSGEDKIEKGAKREGLSPEEIADKYIKVFDNDALALNIITPEERPRATGEIKPMIDMVKTLLEKDYAYSTDLAIYFNVSKFKNYTQLSGQDLDKNISDAGKGEINDSDKKNSADFAIWFFKAGAHENALQTWPSSFESPLVKNGEGFPGWHLECSAMSRRYLGDTIDLHMGGIEHIPVHHTNEIAQSEATTGKKFVNYWLHNEHLTVDGGKMAKSEGTAYSVSEIIDRGYDPLAIRYFFCQAHYRSKQNFTWEALDGAQSALNNLKDKLTQLGSEKGERDKKFQEKFEEALEDDFNLPQALAVVWDILKSDLSAGDKRTTILDFDRVLGLDLDKVKKIEIPQEVEELVQKRVEARKNKNFDEADKLRDEILKLGFEVADSDNGYVINPIK